MMEACTWCGGRMAVGTRRVRDLDSSAVYHLNLGCWAAQFAGAGTVEMRVRIDTKPPACARCGGDVTEKTPATHLGDQGGLVHAACQSLERPAPGRHDPCRGHTNEHRR